MPSISIDTCINPPRNHTQDPGIFQRIRGWCMYQCWWRAFWISLVRKSFMWYAGTYLFFCNMEIKRFRTHVHITKFRLLSVRNVSWSLCSTFLLRHIYIHTFRINLPLFSTVVPSSIFMFLSCRPSVVITTLSTGLVGVEVTSVSWLGQLTVGV